MSKILSRSSIAKHKSITYDSLTQHYLSRDGLSVVSRFCSSEQVVRFKIELVLHFVVCIPLTLFLLSLSCLHCGCNLDIDFKILFSPLYFHCGWSLNTEFKIIFSLLWFHHGRTMSTDCKMFMAYFRHQIIQIISIILLEYSLRCCIFLPTIAYIDYYLSLISLWNDMDAQVSTRKLLSTFPSLTFSTVNAS